MPDTDKAVSILNDLIQTCRDGEEGFKTAADGVQDSNLKSLFTQYSQQRANFARVLEEEVVRLGAKPEERGSVSGALHRGWINIKAAVTGKSDDAIISEAERGEDVAKEAYQKALNQALPVSALSVVQQQATQVLEAHDRVRALEKAAGKR